MSAKGTDFGSQSGAIPLMLCRLYVALRGKHMTKLFNAILLGSMLLLSGGSSIAQQGFEIGGWLGASHYFGDLNTSFDLMHPGLAGGAIVRYNFNNRLSTKISANYGFLHADDADSKNAFERRRNINFRTHLGDLSAQMEFNFFPYIHGSRENYFSPYLFAGFSIFTYSPFAIYNDEKTPPLRDLGTEGQFIGEEYSTFQRAINFGGGVKFDVTAEWSINIELSIRKLFTDYLDDVSTVYPDLGEVRGNRGALADIAALASDPSLLDDEGNKFGMVGRQRGDDTNNDAYTFFSVGLLYYFGNVKCPDISKTR